MRYTLLNKGNGKFLVHPVMGLWSTSELNEAKEMLEDCKKYLISQGLQAIIGDFVVIDVETEKEI